MLEQEKYRGHLDPQLEEDQDQLHPLYQEVVVQDGSVLYYSPLSGYILRERPVRQARQPGGILADEMGLGKTVEILSLMLSNQRRDVPTPEYQEPIIIQQRKKKRRRRRTPSPVEFHIKESDGEVATEDLIYQVDGGDTGSEDESEADMEAEGADDDSEDFQPGCSVKVKPRTSRRNRTNGASRVYSDERTVYYHEDFDSLSSSSSNDDVDDDRPPPVKRTKTSRKPASANSTTSTSQARGPKIINTLTKADPSHPVYPPFKNDKFNEKSASLYDQIIKAVQVLTDGNFYYILS